MRLLYKLWRKKELLKKWQPDWPNYVYGIITLNVVVGFWGIVGYLFYLFLKRFFV